MVDGQTDRRTDRQTSCDSIASRGKNGQVSCQSARALVFYAKSAYRYSSGLLHRNTRVK